MIRPSLQLRIVLAVIFLTLIAGPNIASAAYNNAGSILLGKTLHASATTNGSFYSMSPYPQMVGYFAEAVHLDRSNSRAYYNLATVYYLMGDYKRAESFLIIAKNLGTEESLVRPGVLETNDKQRFGEEFMLGRQR